MSDDLRLVGVAEVARITGLTEKTVRTYVHRRTIVAPLPVEGGGALVWDRADVEAWAEIPRETGRPRRATLTDLDELIAEAETLGIHGDWDTRRASARRSESALAAQVRDLADKIERRKAHNARPRST